MNTHSLYEKRVQDNNQVMHFYTPNKMYCFIKSI